LDAAGNIYVAGVTNIDGAYGTSFVAKIDVQGILGIMPGGVVNATSYRPGAVAPGELVTVFGSGLGPFDIGRLTLDTAGVAATALAGTRVLFDGVPAPLIYVQPNQINAVVPYAIAVRARTQVQIEAGGMTSEPVEFEVADTAPGIFTIDSSGSGQAAALNEDGSLNSVSNPASRGSVVVLYATGAGQTDPAGVDGSLPRRGDALPKPLREVSVRIGGQTAEVLYAGGAPLLINGV